MATFNASQFLAGLSARKTTFSLTDADGRTVKLTVDGGCKDDYDDAMFNLLVAAAETIKSNGKIDPKEGHHVARSVAGVTTGSKVAPFLPPPLKTSSVLPADETVPPAVADRMNGTLPDPYAGMTANVPADTETVETNGKGRKGRK